jgi:DNA polymerase
MVEGFFTTQETATAATIRKIKGCLGCGLHLQCNIAKMETHGKGTKVLVIADRPNAREDEEGFGAGDNLLRKELNRVGLDLRLDCRKTYAVKCRPKGDREPTPLEVEYCRPDVLAEIEKMRPNVIIALGIGAVESLVGHRVNGGIGGIDKWRGWAIPDREFGAWIVPVMSPNHVAQVAEKNRSVLAIWRKDLALAAGLLTTPLPSYTDEFKCVEILDKESDIEDLLYDMTKSDMGEVAFDYETTGLKPYRQGHRIVSCAVCNDMNKAFAFEWPKKRGTLRAWRKLMESGVGKIAQNMKFEDLWTNIICGHGVNNWIWDTMLVTHQLDNRNDITGLKFQTYVQLGVLGYEDAVLDYLKADAEEERAHGGNAFNRIHLAPKKELLIYNGLDALLEYQLAQKQQGHLFDLLKDMQC